MRRRLFNLAVGGAAAVSLVLCAATIALWFRARDGRSDSVVWWSPTSDELQRCTAVTTTHGIVFVGTVMHEWSYKSATQPGKPIEGFTIILGDYRWTTGLLFLMNTVENGSCGPAWAPFAIANTSRVHIVAMPLWFPALLFAIAPARLTWRYGRLARRRRAGRCGACGYDLRATARTPQEGGALLDRCPECGAVPAPAR